MTKSMTVWDFWQVCDYDKEDVYLEYIVLTDEGEEPIRYFSRDGFWASNDANYGEDDEGELEAKIKITPDELDDAEIISVKLGTFTEIRIRL